MKILVTGGAGFIGSHLIDALINQANAVVCIDDLSLGRRENIAHHIPNVLTSALYRLPFLIMKTLMLCLRSMPSTCFSYGGQFRYSTGRLKPERRP